MLSLELYKKLYLVRSAERGIIANYSLDEMKTPMHMSTGAEHIAVGVCHALEEKGQFLSTYRSHAVYLATAQETGQFFGELYGRVNGVAKGKAGSMHLSSIQHGYLGASAIVASTLPVAVGLAYANKLQGTQKVIAVFFGDGAIDEGNFWESLNMSCVMKLPLLFICEDNGLAVHTPKIIRHGYADIQKVVQQFDCATWSCTTTDVEEVYRLTQEAVASIQRNKKPAFLHLPYYRYLEHVGVYEDFGAGYRQRDEGEAWFKKDPLDLQRKRLLQLGCSESDIRAIEIPLDEKVQKSIEQARQAAFPEREALYEDIYA